MPQVTWALLKHFAHPGGAQGFILGARCLVAPNGAQLSMIGYNGSAPGVVVVRSTDLWSSNTTPLTVAETDAVLGGGVTILSSGRLLAAMRGPTDTHWYISDDDGVNWSLADSIAWAGTLEGVGPPIEMPSAAGTCFTAAHGQDGGFTPQTKLYKSTDFGATWTNVTPAAAPWNAQQAGDGVNLLFGSAAGSLFISFPATGGSGATIHRSANLGTTFPDVFTAGLTDATLFLSGLEANGRLYAGAELISNAGAPVYVSDDDGVNWAILGRPTVAGMGFRMQAWWQLTRLGPDHLIGVGTGAVGALPAAATFSGQSTDGGVTWERDIFTPNTDSLNVVTSFLLGADGFGYAAGVADAIYVTTSALVVASELNPVANVGTGRLVALFPQSDGTAVQFYSTDNGETWTQGVTVPDLRGAATPPTSKLRSPSDGQLLFGLKGDISGSLIARSVNSGVSWLDVLTLAGDNVINNFVVMDEPATLADEAPSAPPINPSLTADSEHRSVPVQVTDNTIFFLVNNVGADMVLVNDGDAALIIMTTGLVLSKADAPLSGHYLGWTLRGEDPPFRVETVEMEVVPSRTWDNTP